MSVPMRAKMVIDSVTRSEDSDSIGFRAVYRGDSYPSDGSDENNTFSKFTPSANLHMVIQNDALIGKFNVGDEFYVDFTPIATRG